MTDGFADAQQVVPIHEIDGDVEEQRQRDPRGGPRQRLSHGDVVGPAVEQTQIDRHGDEDENEKAKPEGAATGIRGFIYLKWAYTIGLPQRAAENCAFHAATRSGLRKK